MTTILTNVLTLNIVFL